jgi:hypothetical protein
MPQLTLRQYVSVFFGIVVLIGIVTFILTAEPSPSSNFFDVQEPIDAIEVVDEFVPLSFTFTPPSAEFGAFAEGNFWLLLRATHTPTDGKTTEPILAPFYPREIPRLFTNDGMNTVRFGEKDFALDRTHEFSGYAYISPSDVFDGTYEGRILFMKTEEGKSPQHLGESGSFTVSIKRVFNLQHNLIVAQQPTAIQKKGEEWTLMSLNVRAASSDITLRALELGAPSVRRIPDAITSLALYDTSTGEKVSTLTDTKISALTLERYTVYVLDTPFVVNSQFTRTFELRATVDESLLLTDRSIQFALVRMYGINTEQQKTAESTPDIGVRILLPRE